MSNSKLKAEIGRIIQNNSTDNCISQIYQLMRGKTDEILNEMQHTGYGPGNAVYDKVEEYIIKNI